MNVLEYTEWERPRICKLSDAELRVAIRLKSAITVEAPSERTLPNWA